MYVGCEHRFHRRSVQSTDRDRTTVEVHVPIVMKPVIAERGRRKVHSMM